MHCGLPGVHGHEGCVPASRFHFLLPLPAEQPGRGNSAFLEGSPVGCTNSEPAGVLEQGRKLTQGEEEKGISGQSWGRAC